MVSRLPRWLSRTALALGILVLLLVAGTMALLRTDPGRALLAGAVEDVLRMPGEQEILIGRLDGALPGEIVLSDVRLRDRDGEWLAIDTARLQWRPWALLSRRVVIDRLSVDGLHVARAPVGGAEPADDAPSRGIALPAVPVLPVDVRLREFDLDDVTLGAALLGEAVVLRASGRFGVDASGDARGRLLIERSDGVAAQLALDAVLEAATRTLDIDLAVAEPPGGMVARLADMPGLPAVSASLKGRGPATDWRGRLHAEARGVAMLDADVTIGLGDRLSFGLSGAADLSRLLDADLQAFTGPVPQFDILAALDVDDAILIEHARLSGLAVEAVLRGRLDRRKSVADLALDAELLDPSVVARFADGVTVTSADLSAALRGPLEGASLDATVSAAGLRAEGVAVGHIESRIQATVAPQRIDGTISAALSGVSESAGLPPLPSRVDLATQAAFDPAGQTLVLSGLRATGDGFDLSGSGRIDLSGGGVAADIAASLGRLAPYASFAGIDLDGRADIAAALSRAGAANDVHGKVTLKLVDLDSRDLPLAPTLGRAATIDATIAALSASGLDAPEVTVRGANLALSGRLAMAENWRTLDLTLALADHDLAPWQALADVGLAGHVAGTITVDGPLADPRADVALAVTALSAAGVGPFDGRLTIAAHALASAPAGDVALALRGPPGLLDLATQFALTGPDRLALEGIRLDAAGARASGNLAVDLASGLASGRLDLAADDLAPTGKLAGLRLRGRAKAHVTLVAGQGVQGATLAFDAPSLGLAGADGSDIALEGVSALVELTELAPSPSGHAALNVARTTAGELQLDALSATLSGSTGSVAFEMAGAGRFAAPFELSVAGSAALAAPRWSATLARFDGNIADHPFALEAPTRLAIAPDRSDLAGLALRFGDGRVTAQGTLDEQRVAARLDIADLPLAPAMRVAGLPPTGGTLSATATLDGAPADPVGALDLHLANIVAGDLDVARRVALHGNATARLEGGRLQLDADVGGFSSTGLVFAADLPARLSLHPFVLALPDDERIAGTLDWQGEVATLWEMLPLDDHRLAGKADVSAAAGGTLAEPTVTARLAFADGRYENLSLGTVIDRLAVSAEVDAGRVLSVTLSGTDGGRGALSGKGRVALLPDAGFPADIALTFADATLIRRDELTAAANGDLTLSGDMTALALAGRIETTRIEARIDESLPPGIVELDVVEAHATAQNEQPETTEKPGTLTLDLDFVVPGQAFVRGRGLDSEWRGDLRITGDAAAPKIAGTMSFVRGRFDFAGKPFGLDGSTLTFDGTEEIDPLLNIRAAHEAEDITALILITGRASDPKIALTSSPTLPQDEVLARVLFGKNAGALSPVETLQLAGAVAQLSGAGPSGAGLLDRVRQTLGVDVLEVDAPTNGNGGPSVRAGRYVNERTFVGVTQGTEVGSTGVVVEIEVLPDIVVDTEVDQSGASKSGIKWKRDY